MTEAQTSGARRVLFVEDDGTVRNAVSRLLECDGFTVESAPNAVIARRLAHSRTHDAMLLDLVLPDIPGLGLLAELNREGILIPCVVLTGVSRCQSALEAGHLGVLSYLEKPATASELIASLRNATDVGSLRLRTRLFATRPQAYSVTSILLAEAHALIRQHAEHTQGEADETLCTELARPLARAASSPFLTLSQFVAVATVLKGLLNPPYPKPLGNVLSLFRESFAEAAACDALPDQPEAVMIIDTLEAAGRGIRSLREEELASTLGLRVAQLGQLIDEHYRISYATCRLALVMRRVVCELARGPEHVRQIGFHVGYEDHGNFDRAFRSFFGVYPRAFRRLAAVNPES